jgi:Family of unknown function (DUF6011)
MEQTMSDFDFNDSLDFDAPQAKQLPAAQPREAGKPPVGYKPVEGRIFTEPCKKCGGTGTWTPGWARYDLRPGRQCFECKGTGKLTFKTSADHRAKARTRANEKKIAAVAAFAEEHKGLIAWVGKEVERQAWRREHGKSVFDFPIKMLEGLARYGSWTDAQVAALQKLKAQSEERAKTYAVERQTRQDAAPVVDATKIAEAFKRAQKAAKGDGEGIYGLVLRLDTFRFSPDRTGSGDIWIKEGDSWLGKIVAGKLQRFRACTDEQEKRILAAAADPAAAAKAYGQRFKSCSCCGKALTNEESRALGIGPVCASRWFG